MNSNKGLGENQLTEFTNSTAVYVNQKKLFEDIKFMIKTPKGSVLGFPEYGSDVLSMLYKAGTRATLDLVSSSVYDVLNKFSGVTVLNVVSEYNSTKTAISVKYDIVYNSIRIANEVSISTEV